MLTMKTIYILAAFLGLQFNTLFAVKNFSELPVLSNEIVTGITNSMLMPVTPGEATFEDVEEISFSTIEIAELCPVLPIVADFTDGAPTTEISLVNLAPVTPKEADFEDETGICNESLIQQLTPETPKAADFEDQV
jgi:hypothetical protein